MADEREVSTERMRAADALTEFDGGKTTPGPLGASESVGVDTHTDEVLADANAEVPLPVVMSPAEIDARADAVEAVEQAIEADEAPPSKAPEFNEVRPEP